MPDAYPRDLIGYAGAPPHPKWPGDARIAVNFVMNYEEGSEYSVPDGDGYNRLTGHPSRDLNGPQRAMTPHARRPPL